MIAGCGDVLDLTVNFRSAPAILAEVECCVRPVMTPEPGVQPEFQRLLACESPVGSTGFVRGRWAPVEFWVSWPEPGHPAARVRAGEATQIEATALARDIRALHDEAGAGWGGFGVLVRSTGDVDVYLQALRYAASRTSSSATARTTGGGRSSKPPPSSVRCSIPLTISPWSPCCARRSSACPTPPSCRCGRAVCRRC